jgi:chromosome transmission fidelity protein 1
MDAIAGIYSAYVTLKQLKLARAQLGVYLQKFRNKVKGKNRVYLAQIIRVIDSLTAFLEARECSSSSTTTTVPELLSEKGADQVDLYKLSVYLRESRLARKVDGYVEYSAQTSAESERKPSMPVLCHIEGFLLALMSPSKEGKFFYETTEDGELQLKYLLLDPAFHFRDVVEEARSVILIGGTMSPVSKSVPKCRSFPNCPDGRIYPATVSIRRFSTSSYLELWPHHTRHQPNGMARV